MNWKYKLKSSGKRTLWENASTRWAQRQVCRVSSYFLSVWALNWGTAPIKLLWGHVCGTLIREGSAHCGQCHPEHVDLGCIGKQGEQAMDCKQWASISPQLLPLLPLESLPVYPLKGLWSGHIRQINPPLKLSCITVFNPCNRQQTATFSVQNKPVSKQL